MGKEKGCTRHLTNSLSTQPDDDDVDDDDDVLDDDSDDIASSNAHIKATISGVGILLGGQDGKCDESAFSGDPELISMSTETLFRCTGATANAGNRHYACHCGRRSFNCWRQYCNVRTPGFGSWGVHKRRYSRKILDIDLQTTDVLGRKETTWSRPCAPLRRGALRQPPARTRPAR